MNFRNATREQIHKHVYNTRRWQSLRRDYVENAEYCCEGCGWRKESKYLILHHRVPIKDGGAIYSHNNLELLCRRCHFKQHGFQPWMTRKRKENIRDQWFTDLNNLGKRGC